jgi:hypothetical protein
MIGCAETSRLNPTHKIAAKRIVTTNFRQVLLLALNIFAHLAYI